MLTLALMCFSVFLQETGAVQQPSYLAGMAIVSPWRYVNGVAIFATPARVWSHEKTNGEADITDG